MRSGCADASFLGTAAAEILRKNESRADSLRWSQLQAFEGDSVPNCLLQQHRQESRVLLKVFHAEAGRCSSARMATGRRRALALRTQRALGMVMCPVAHEGAERRCEGKTSPLRRERICAAEQCEPATEDIGFQHALVDACSIYHV